MVGDFFFFFGLVQLNLYMHTESALFYSTLLVLFPHPDKIPKCSQIPGHTKSQM